MRLDSVFVLLCSTALCAVRLQTIHDTFLIPAIALVLFAASITDALSLVAVPESKNLVFNQWQAISRRDGGIVAAAFGRLEYLLAIPPSLCLRDSVPAGYRRTAINTFRASSVTPINSLPMSVRGPAVTTRPHFGPDPRGRHGIIHIPCN